VARFCAALAPADPGAEVVRMAGHPIHLAPTCALGIYPHERPGGTAGPYRAPAGGGCAGKALIAAGEVSLFNRGWVREALGRELPDPGECSDGELLLRWYARAGVEGLADLRGMFAVAIWDGASLVLARDPVGARTLFYARDGERWLASSALMALRRSPRVPARINLNAVRSFLTFAYLPGEETLLDGVSELLPGRCLRLHPGGRSESLSYWEPSEGEWDEDIRPGAYAARLRALVEAATRDRLPAGEDVGVLLSGGLDSSLVTALAAKLHDRPVRTYSISFGDDLPNERAYADLVAAHCGTHHRVLSFRGIEVADHLGEAVALLDCPVGDPLTVPNLLLARAAAADGLRVILNGEGGDPIFGGPKNIPMLLFELHRTDPGPGARARAYLFAYRKCYEDLPELLSDEVHRALADAPPLERLVEPLLESDRMRFYLNRLMYANLRTKGAHHILTKVERLTAACGLEGRAPLFDREVVEYSFAIPPALKLAGTSEKWVLKRAARDLLPSTIVDRPKSGMRVPVQQWLRGPLRVLARDVLLGRRARERELFRPEPIREWMNGEGALWPRQGGKLWLLITLELWLRAFVDGEGM
jgi:asparagine synthase (glutamine-hydrolysing)